MPKKKRKPYKQVSGRDSGSGEFIPLDVAKANPKTTTLNTIWHYITNLWHPVLIVPVPKPAGKHESLVKFRPKRKRRKRAKKVKR